MSRRPKPSGEDWSLDRVLDTLTALGSEKNRAGMARFGIDTSRAFGVPMAELRPLARRIGKQESLADELWASGYHEARLLAILIIPPVNLTDARALHWLSEIRSWDHSDQLTNVLARREGSDALIAPLAANEKEFLRRAAFALIAWRAVHAKKSPDTEFLSYLPLIRTAASDPRNFVWKAVHWALRQIGKRSSSLHGPALKLAEELFEDQNKTVKRVGREAFRELNSDKVRQRLSISKD
ncbi:DNA alkylation repair protein [Roseibium alexandrii]|uniref:Putative DNA alkylation repair enzyme n=1 Tax=Roseibium alexandrii (strain DSM 17067 / NCIMB 14079 / DFL-11) TaxID=244592 RepID=A0A5E8GV21_ROSAD|nr:DNA alkylation repair protein [Roseibium alexandrii]EEE43790.1 putative DNA alkylation repair enzyme [Roseibium alexandrii DFL-11]